MHSTNTFEAQPFADINEFAAVIGTQNHQYELMGEIKHPEVVNLNRNKVAFVQQEHVDMLGQLASELPYDELAQAHLDAENELQAAEARRSVAEEESKRAILGVHAWAARLEHEFGLDSDMADQGIADRTAKITETNGTGLDQRITQLRQTLGSLSVIWEVAGEAWPVPWAIPVEELASPSGTQFSNGAGNTKHAGISVSASGPKVSDSDIESSKAASSVRVYGEHQVEQPDASVLIAAHMARSGDQTVTVDELVELLYGHCNLDDQSRYAYRSRVTTLMGPKIQGERIQAMLEPTGRTLIRGWRVVVNMLPGGIIRQVKRRRVYRTASIVETNGAQTSFTEYDFGGTIVDENGELISSEQHQLVNAG